jgi:hypothetical protein
LFRVKPSLSVAGCVASALTPALGLPPREFTVELADLLSKHGIDPAKTLVLRHRPPEKPLRKVFPWLAAERHDLFDAYQRNQSPKLEKALTTAGFVASFIGHQPGRALFVGFYAVTGWKPLTVTEFFRRPDVIELKRLGMEGPPAELFQPHRLWFDMPVLPVSQHWKGRLVVNWPPPEISWWRWADKNSFAIHCIHEEGQLVAAVPEWDTLNLTWNELSALPASWRAALGQWRGIYYIFDVMAGKGYVGSAAGKDNILGRWEGYSATGHGGNKLLKALDPLNFRFSILQRVSPDLTPAEVVAVENSWKDRLHTRAPHGLNEN